ncbi:hypothetical protein [Actinomadura sp. GTD37]|uniref:hypothetical protein n=1 Tax=Actinomadura sp. GTD37 TaxID=1778030 RepID=UPI0035BF310F
MATPQPPVAEQPLDCRSPAGVTVGLIDSIITAARVLRDRDLSHPAVREALADLAEDEDVARLMPASKKE